LSHVIASSKCFAAGCLRQSMKIESIPNEEGLVKCVDRTAHLRGACGKRSTWRVNGNALCGSHARAEVFRIVLKERA
jgi:hypothetical protein